MTAPHRPFGTRRECVIIDSLAFRKLCGCDHEYVTLQLPDGGGAAQAFVVNHGERCAESYTEHADEYTCLRVVQPRTDDARQTEYVGAGGLDAEAIADHVRQLLVLFGEDPTRPAFAETPERVAALWIALLETNEQGPMPVARFEVTTDHIVMLGGIRVWTMCPEHLTPRALDVTIAYRPVAAAFESQHALRRLVWDATRGIREPLDAMHVLAHALRELTESEHVAALAREPAHECDTVVGYAPPLSRGHLVFLGDFHTDADARAEFWRLADANDARSRR